MKSYFFLLFATLNLLFIQELKTFAQTGIPEIRKTENDGAYELRRLLFAGSPNHREIVVKSFHLAENKGFNDTIGITHEQILDRLEAGSYSEDFESIPGIVGEHFPAPWNQGPNFDFYGYYPITKIPFGSYVDTLSGWSRGLYHGFDPVQGFHWPGTNLTTIEWANYLTNNFSWDHAVSLYQSGQKEEACECLGHILHLLADQSIPTHVSIINHGISITSLHTGSFYEPDLLKLVVDEYELALAGGISIPNIFDFIPDILNNFRSSLNMANPDSVKILSSWDQYFNELAKLTYYNSVVEQYFSPSDSEGTWGNYTNGNGEIINPIQYFLTPPAEIADRWAQISLQCTASEQGTVFPKQQMEELSAQLVPRTVEYSTGLILYFLNHVTETEELSTAPSGIYLSQNFPNPFNPSTSIRYTLNSINLVDIRIYDLLGKEIAVLVKKEQPVGDYEIEFSADRIANQLSSGIYIYQLKAGEYRSVKKMIYLK